MNVKRFINHNKGISPIFATLILIAIAVIAGVVVYMFTSGTLATMTGGGTAAQEKVTVQGVNYVPGTGSATGTVSVYAQNMASTGSITANGILIKNTQGATVATVTVSTPLAAGTLATVSGSPSVALTSGTYTATITTGAGGNFLSQPFVVS